MFLKEQVTQKWTIYHPEFHCVILFCRTQKEPAEYINLDLLYLIYAKQIVLAKKKKKTSWSTTPALKLEHIKWLTGREWFWLAKRVVMLWWLVFAVYRVLSQRQIWYLKGSINRKFFHIFKLIHSYFTWLMILNLFYLNCINFFNVVMPCL